MPDNIPGLFWIVLIIIAGVLILFALGRRPKAGGGKPALRWGRGSQGAPPEKSAPKPPEAGKRRGLGRRGPKPERGGKPGRGRKK